MISTQVRIVNFYGLHARAAARLVKLAAGFESRITLTREFRRVNGKSIMDVLMLAASQGTIIGVEVCGLDEQAASEALLELIQAGFDELEPKPESGIPETA